MRAGVLLGLLCASPAWALDGTGSEPAIGEGEVTDPMVALHPVRPSRDRAWAGLTLELASKPLVFTVVDAGETSEVDVLEGLFGAHLSGSASFHDRVSVGVSLPLWLGASGAAGTGPALGDLRVQAPVALVRPGVGGKGFGLSVVPWLDAPTGNAARFLGRGAFGGGAWGVVGYGFGAVRASLDLGLDASGAEPAYGVDDRARVGGAGAISWAIRDSLGLTAEMDVAKPLVGPASGEARLGGRGRVPGGVELSGGVGVGVLPGAGTAAWRAYAGVGYVFGKKTAHAAPAATSPAEEAHDPYDVVVDVTDEAGAPLLGASVTATRGEDVRVGTTNADGQATIDLDPGPWELTIAAEGRGAQRRSLGLDDRVGAAEVRAVLPVAAGEARLAVTLADPEGRPVEDAEVAVDGQSVGVTGPGGSLTLEGLAPGERKVTVAAPGFVAPAPVVVQAKPGAAASPIVLHRPPGSVKVRVRSAEGAVPDALLRLVGPEDLAPTPVGATGERDFVLAPGVWQVVVSSREYGLQSREIVIREDDEALVVVDVLLAAAERGAGALSVRVVDPDGRPVEGAEVRVDGVKVGRTSNAGALSLDGLDVGTRRVEVAADHFRPAEAREVELVPGERDVLWRMDWLPGSVEVVARGPDGPVEDAMVRFSGPSVVGPEALGADGRGFFTLAPGEWAAALSSAAFGLQSRELVVGPDDRELLLVEAVMHAQEEGRASLVVRVVDPDGHPVDGAAVTVDGLAVGRTSSGGSLRLEGLQPGKRTVSVSAELFEDATLAAIPLQEGENQATARLAWVPGSVLLRAVGPDGAPVDGLARFYGAESLPPVRLGEAGERAFSLAPGAWTAVVSSETFGLAQATVEVRPGTAGRTEVEVKFADRPVDRANLLVEVVDPDGAPVSGARLRIGDATFSLARGGQVLEGQPVGTRRARLEAEGYEPLDVERLSLVAGPQERRFVLRPIPRPVRVAVTGKDGAPVKADLRLVGPRRVAPLATDAAGKAESTLLPGTWQLLVSAPEYAAERVDVEIAPGSGAVPVEVHLRESRLSVTEAEVLLRQEVRFRFNEAALSPESFEVLDELAATLRANPGIGRIEVQGHTDAVGSEAYNVALSQRRAEVVRDYLVARGVPRERLEAKGYGTSRAEASNDTEAGRARNRRVQFERIE